MNQENHTMPHEQSLSQNMRAEIVQLQQQLQLRDQLVAQLSTELFRLIRAHPPALLAAKETVEQTDMTVQEESLRQELKVIEQQIGFYQEQIDQRDAEIVHLQASCQGLSDRNQMLELVIQDLPEVYRQKFSDRLTQVKTKVQSLELENRRLYDQLQTGHNSLPSQQQGTNWQLSLPASQRRTLHQSAE